MRVAGGLAKMEVKHDFYQNISYQSKAKFEERVYRSNTGQPSYERAANDRLSQTPILGNSSIENTQRCHGLKFHTQMEKFSIQLTRSKEPTLRRKARGASNKSQNWKRLICEAADNADFPSAVEIWCQIYHEDTKISKLSPYAPGDRHCVDRFSYWTKEEPAKYVRPKPRCLNCTPGTVWPWKRFIPIATRGSCL